MYNAATQVQDSIDANLGSYFQKIKIAVGASPTAFPFKKKILSLLSVIVARQWLLNSMFP
jgi:hypothetical protein